jgi:hypothetical protein
MTARRAACSCGQLSLTIEGELSRISMCHCLERQRRTGAVISNQARFRREEVTFTGKATAWMRTAESGNALTFHFLSDLRLHRLPGERRLSWICRRCRRQLCRPEFPRSDHRGVGRVTPPLDLPAARDATQARRQAGVINNRGLPPGADLPCHGLLAADTDPPTQNDIASEAASPATNHADPRRALRHRQSGRGLAGRRNIAE